MMEQDGLVNKLISKSKEDRSLRTKKHDKPNLKNQSHEPLLCKEHGYPYERVYIFILFMLKIWLLTIRSKFRQIFTINDKTKTRCPPAPLIDEFMLHYTFYENYETATDIFYWPQ